MRPLRRFLRRLVSFATVRRDNNRLRDEIEEHIALQTLEYLGAGLPPAEARRQAVLKFGGVEAMKESYREQQGLPRLETLLRDIRYAFRHLRRAPAFTTAVVLTLALGIGATTSIFTLIDAVLLRSLPVANPAELYRLGKESTCCYSGGYSQENGFSLVSYDLYRYLRDHTSGFSELAAFPAPVAGFGVRRSGSPEAVQGYPGEFVSGNYFITFGISAYAGRALTAADDWPGAPPVAVMSYRVWREKYGSDPSVIGAAFLFNGRPVTVVGIAPPEFFGDALRPTPPDFFLPLNAEPLVQVDTDLNKYDTHWLQLIGRIRPGTNAAAVEAEMRVALQQWLRSHWGEMSPGERAKLAQQTLFLTPGGAGITRMREQYGRWLEILMMVSGVVLLIVCANIANLMLVRGMERRRQTSLSMALGARTAHVVRGPLIESLLLSLSGGAAGLAIAYGGTRLLLRFAFPPLPGLSGVPIAASPSLAVLGFAFVTSLLTGVAFGIAPAWMAAHVDPIEALRGGRSGARAGSLSRKALIVVQVALSLALVAAAGLLTNTLRRFENQDFGFDPARRVVATMNPRLAGYRTVQLPALYRRIRDQIATIPGVSSVALCLYSPQSGRNWGAAVRIEGHPELAPGEDQFASWNRVSAGYFDVIGNPIVRGRGITDLDTATSRKVAVISEAFARKFFRSEDPIGKQFRSTASASPDPVEVVGIARDARYLTLRLDQPAAPLFFLAETQANYTAGNIGSLFLNDIVVEVRPGASVPFPAIRQAMAAVDPGMPLAWIHTLREQVAERFTQQRLMARLTSLFAVLSLLLASIGLYGVTAYNAGRRGAEVGVRIALGAGRGDIVREMLRGSLALILLGLLLGLPATFAVGRLLGTQLYGMRPYDPAVTMTAILALALPALVATLIPAFRASSTSPHDALRSE
jgi:predicted permease